jgi:hypothetical protein
MARRISGRATIPARVAGDPAEIARLEEELKLALVEADPRTGKT